MKSHRINGGWAAWGLVALLSTGAVAEDLGSVFSYQGRIKQSGTPLNAAADFEFTLWDAAAGGNQIGAVSSASNVNVVDGLFTVGIDFGVAAFDGQARWLETSVRSPAGGGSFVRLAPRQALTVAPYALQTRGLFVDDAGNLGVGNSSPTSKVDVSGLVTATGFLGDGAALTNLSASALATGSISDALLSSNVALLDAANIFTNPGDTSFAGKLGIGTTAPTAMLHVSGGDTTIDRGATTTGLTRTLTLGGARGSASPSFARLQFQNYDTNSGQADYIGAAILSFNPSGVDSGDLRFHTTPDLATGAVERVRIDHLGNVGIGTSTGGFPLTFADQLGDKISLHGQSGNHFGLGIQTSLLQIYTSTSAGDVGFGYGTSSSFTERMRIKGNGNVGIGTTTPGFPLTFADQYGAKISLYGQSGNHAGLGVQDSLVQMYGANSATDIAFGYGSSTSFTERMRIKGNGRVGVGLTSPSALLHSRTTADGLSAVRGDGNAVAAVGVEGTSNDGAGIGVLGRATTTTGFNFGVVGRTSSSDGVGVSGEATRASGSNTGVYGYAHGTDGYGVFGDADGTNGIGVHGQATGASGYGVFSTGNIAASGTKSFLIDHPLDPENKTLRHYCAEGPEPMNEYSGVVSLDRNGEAWVALPNYFESINRDFRYQLTCLGQFAPVYVREEIRDGAFLISGGEPGMRVSWEVKGVRDDAFVRTYGAPVEQAKTETNRGRFLQPELYGFTAEYGQFNRAPRPVESEFEMDEATEAQPVGTELEYQHADPSADE
ncbi:MAG: hypothetical protein FLDDKLPJ_03592 [Phycisphaerae bacterium]|nr:hypothetical protein [Phycisphaerae bacterium]